MPRRIIIHGGFHLSGGATSQNTLRENRVAMKKQTALRLPWHLKDVLPASRAYAASRDPAALPQVQAHFDALMTALPGMPRRTLILSADDLIGPLPGQTAAQDYTAAPVLFYAYWEIARKHFPAADIQFHLSTRAPDVWLAAAYAHLVETTDLTLSFDAFCTQYVPAADHTGMVAEIASRVPAPVHHCDLATCRDLPLGPADPLLDLCKLPMTLRMGLMPTAHEKTRDDPDLLAALLEANRTHADPKARTAAKEAIRRTAGVL